MARVVDRLAELTGYSRKTVGKRLDDARSAVLRLAGYPPGGQA